MAISPPVMVNIHDRSEPDALKEPRNPDMSTLSRNASLRQSELELWTVISGDHETQLAPVKVPPHQQVHYLKEKVKEVWGMEFPAARLVVWKVTHYLPAVLLYRTNSYLFVVS